MGHGSYGGMGTHGSCQECYKNSALFAQFLLSPLTYVSLSYFVRFHCANVHTPFMFLLSLTTSRTSKQGIQIYSVLGRPLGQLHYWSWLFSYSGPGSAPSSHRRGVSALSGDSTMSRPANWWTKRSPSSSASSTDKASL